MKSPVLDDGSAKPNQPGTPNGNQAMPGDGTSRSSLEVGREGRRGVLSPRSGTRVEGEPSGAGMARSGQKSVNGKLGRRGLGQH